MNASRGTRIFLAILLGILTLLLIEGITLAAVPGGIASVEHLSISGNVFYIIVIALLVALVLGTIIYLIFIKIRKSSRTVHSQTIPLLAGELPTLRIGFEEEPLKAQSLISVISALTDLHTKCWLIEHERFDDFIEYAEIHDTRFAEEANLVIASITHNSPTIIDLLLGSASIAAAMKLAIDAVVQTPHRLKAKKLENEKKELDLDKERWDFQQKRINDSIEVARKVIQTVRPDIDQTTKANLIQHFLPTYSGVESIKVLEIHLPSSIDQKEGNLLTANSQNEVK
jgi:hypothetical protein